MSFTKLELIDLALNQAQLDSSYRPNARIWLKMIIEKQSKEFKWPFYRKLTPFVPLVANQTSYNIPTDMRRPDEIYLYNSAGQKGSHVPILDSYEFDQTVVGTLTGQPSFAMYDIDTAKIIFNSSPSSTTDGYKMRYFRNCVSPSTTSSDDGVAPDFDDQNFLVQELMKWAMENLDDERQDKKRQEAKEDLLLSKRQVYENDGTSKFNLQQDTFRKRRRY